MKKTLKTLTTFLLLFVLFTNIQPIQPPVHTDTEFSISVCGDEEDDISEDIIRAE